MVKGSASFPGRQMPQMVTGAELDHVAQWPAAEPLML